MDGGARWEAEPLFAFFGGGYYRNNNLRRYHQTLFGLGVVRRFRGFFLNRERPVWVVNNHRRWFDRLRRILRARHGDGHERKNRQ